MKNKIKSMLALAIVTVVIVCGISSVSAKSYEYVLNYGVSQTVGFTKYDCTDNVHTAIRAYSINGSSSSIDTRLYHGNSSAGDTIQTKNTIVDKTNYDYQLDFRATGGGTLHVRWRNYTSGTSVHGRFFINNGLYGE